MGLSLIGSISARTSVCPIEWCFVTYASSSVNLLANASSSACTVRPNSALLLIVSHIRSAFRNLSIQFTCARVSRTEFSDQVFSASVSVCATSTSFERLPRLRVNSASKVNETVLRIISVLSAFISGETPNLTML